MLKFEKKIRRQKVKITEGYTEYITPKVHHHVQAPPLQAVDIITSIKINNANGVEEH